METVDLVTFTGETLMRNLIFLSSIDNSLNFIGEIQQFIEIQRKGLLFIEATLLVITDRWKSGWQML